MSKKLSKSKLNKRGGHSRGFYRREGKNIPSNNKFVIMTENTNQNDSNDPMFTVEFVHGDTENLYFVPEKDLGAFWKGYYKTH